MKSFLRILLVQFVLAGTMAYIELELKFPKVVVLIIGGAIIEYFYLIKKYESEE